MKQNAVFGYISVNLQAVSMVKIQTPINPLRRSVFY